LDAYPGRAFRFCANNQREAEALVVALRDRRPPTEPRRVLFVTDRLDPWSTDFAAWFRSAVARAFPRAEISEAGGDLPSAPEPSPRLSPPALFPNAVEQQRARAIWKSIVEAPPGETWIILVYQNEPARRVLAALGAAAPARYDAQARPVTVVCGDSMGVTTLSEYIKQLVFPVWAVSSSSGFPDPEGPEEDVRVQAEIVAALLIGLDSSGPRASPEQLRQRFLSESSQRAPMAPFGRKIEFTSDGERAAPVPGEVLSLQPGESRVELHAAGSTSVEGSSQPVGGPR
jgi:hypothetical protein